MTGTSETPLNPYIGPRTFNVEQRDFFHGRESEIAILEGLVLSRRTALFFAQSGAGKSSLLRAGLIPKLTKERKIGRGPRARTTQKMHVLPILTVSSGIPGGMVVPIANIFVFAALINLYPPDADCDGLADVTLQEGLAPFLRGDLEDPPGPAGGEPSPDSDRQARNPTLLIFDQFEELFTHYPDRWREREGFFQQINQALLDYPDLHVLFTMREDFIAELTPYANLLPNGLRDRFRLELLKRDAALQAVTEPARLAGRTFAEGVAEALVDNLRRSQPGQRQQTGKPTPEQPLGAYVEPVHLQIVCQQLWHQLPAERTVIQSDDVQAFGDVDQALMDFYEATLAEVFKNPALLKEPGERRLRRWFDDQLITPARTRGLVYQGKMETEGLPNAAVDVLREAYIIRARVRGLDTWYELTHDRMVGPIIEANRRWREAGGAVLSAAERWLAENRDQHYLYEGQQLKNELAVMRRKGAIPLVQEFLEASQKWVGRRRRRLFTTLGIGLIVILVVLYQIGSAELKDIRQGTRMTVLYSGQTFLVTEPESLDGGSPVYVFSLAGDRPQFLRTLEGHTGEIYSAALSPDGRHLATVSYDSTLRIWDLDNLSDTIFFMDPGDIDLTAVVYSPSGDYLAWGNRDGTVRVHDFLKDEQYTLPQHQGLIHTLSFSPDGNLLFVIADTDPEEISYYFISQLAGIDPESEPNLLELGPTSDN